MFINEVIIFDFVFFGIVLGSFIIVGIRKLFLKFDFFFFRNFVIILLVVYVFDFRCFGDNGSLVIG